MRKIKMQKKRKKSGEKFAQTKKVPTFAPANEKQRYDSEKNSKGS